MDKNISDATEDSKNIAHEKLDPSLDDANIQLSSEDKETDISTDISKDTPPESPALDNIIFSPEADSKTKETNQIDPIIQAIRDEIITKQTLLLQSEFAKGLDDEEKEKFLSVDLTDFRHNPEKYLGDQTIEDLVNKSNLKDKLHDIEREGYNTVHTRFKDSFHNVAWDDLNTNNTRSTRVEDKSGNLVCTLNETSVAQKQQTVSLSDGTKSTINKFRIIDFPINLETGNGPMHASMAAMDTDGNNISKKDAVYFTAHYNSTGKLMEISSPTPISFAGKGDDAIGYIEVNNKIFTLPVTQGKYREMTQEITKNNQIDKEKAPITQFEEAPSKSDDTKTISNETKNLNPAEQSSNNIINPSEMEEKVAKMQKSRQERGNEAAEPPARQEHSNETTTPPAIALAEKMKESRQERGNEAAEPPARNQEHSNEASTPPATAEKMKKSRQEAAKPSVHRSDNDKNSLPQKQTKPIQISQPDSKKPKKKTTIKNLLKSSQEFAKALSAIVKILDDAKVVVKSKTSKQPTIRKSTKPNQQAGRNH